MAMSVWRALLCCGLTLVPAGCGHPASTVRDVPTVRTKGGDSATLRIQSLLANGQFQEAEALLIQAIAAGLISREAAARMQERIRQHRQQPPEQRPGPERSPPVLPWSNLEAEEPSRERRTCETELPDHPVCQELPEEYTFHSAQQALNAMKQRLGTKTLALHNPAVTRTGPCPALGEHYNVRSEGGRVGSVVCCPCCVETQTGPIKWTRCRIVW